MAGDCPAQNASLPLSLRLRIDQVCDRFESAHEAGSRPRIEEYLGRRQITETPVLFWELLKLDVAYRERNGEPPTVEEYQARFPEYRELVAKVFRRHDGAAGTSRDATLDLTPDRIDDDPITVESDHAVAAVCDEPLPQWIGRYQVLRRLGSGGFGCVYLALDGQLQREVAIKVPLRGRIAQPEDVEAYLSEARIVARLEHPAIVPVYDVGQTDDGLCFVVSRFIEGRDLAEAIASGRLPPEESARIVAVIADALHYAHLKKLIHWDVKPANILLDSKGRPHLADFGLALKEEDFYRGSRRAGTPAYMSPEQARGEGHLVDGRSDIFSLGIVLYELLTGERPFRGSNWREVLERVKTSEAAPPRQRDDTIPKELERICLKCLAKRASERYTTAADLAEDLRHFLEQNTVKDSGPLRHADDAEMPAAASPPISSPPTPSEPPALSAATAAGRSTTGSSISSQVERLIEELQRVPLSSGRLEPIGITSSDADRAVRVIPRGLHSYTTEDADFFLELLPGPKDREGFPQSIRFWKSRIEQTDADETFRVGVIYGPSGCGKTSLVRAGLLPSLDSGVLPVYVQATTDETESRLLRGLRKSCPDLPADLDLIESLAALRRDARLIPGAKILIVLDQFEQWLHAQAEEEIVGLIAALRHCDGGRVQCLVMVRDDFWLAVSRFMQALDVPLVEGHNSRLVDLFDPRHADKVLTMFGLTFGALPEQSGPLAEEQTRFVQRAVAELADDGKVICVRLALFAEMLKGRPWTLETLDEMGGAEGVGVTFLEETFASRTAPFERRFHRKGAQAVLKSLLPDSQTDIKGNMRSYDELMAACNYQGRPKDFADLMRILDAEVRLITPIDPSGTAWEEDSAPETDPRRKCYQLTHDYLVPSLRAWLTRRQGETRRGRAELRLAERTSIWQRKRENRQLPSWGEFLTISALTSPANWTAAERQMMQRARRVFGSQLLITLSLLALLAWVAHEVRGRLLVDGLLQASENQILPIAEKLHWSIWARWRLQSLANVDAQSAQQRKDRLHARIALTAIDGRQLDPLLDQLARAELPYVLPIRRALMPFQDRVADDLWRIVDDETSSTHHRLNAALVLAGFESQLHRFHAKQADFLVSQMVAVNSLHQPILWNSLRGLRDQLLPKLKKVFQDQGLPESHRTGAALGMVELAYDRREDLLELLLLATPSQYEIIFSRLGAGSPSIRDRLREMVRQQPGHKQTQSASVAFGLRRAGAAITLARLDEADSILELLQTENDLESISQLVHRLRERGVQPDVLLGLLDRAESTQGPAGKPALAPDGMQTPWMIQYALLLALGEFRWEDLDQQIRGPLLDRIHRWYADHPSSGIHGAAGWLLRHWGFDDCANTVDTTPLPFDESGTRQWFVIGIDAADRGTRQKERTPRAFMTFVVMPPVEFSVGSPENEPDRQADESQHPVRLTRPVAVADREITWGQFDLMGTEHRRQLEQLRSLQLDDSDSAFAITWFEAVEYCRWLTRQQGLPDSEQCYTVETPLDSESRERSGQFDIELSRRGFRLLTEAEWEYACRCGTTTPYSFGSDPTLLEKYGWFLLNAKDGSYASGRLRPNRRGLFDLHGGIWEWCHDVYAEYPTTGRAPRWSVGRANYDPQGPASGSERVARGGAWYCVSGSCRSAVRNRVEPADRKSSIGFRLATTIRRAND